MKRTIILVAACIPILFIASIVLFPPVRLFAALAAFEILSSGPPPVLGSVRCEAEGHCKASSATFTANLSRRFPVGSPAENLEKTLSAERFSPIGDESARDYSFPQWPCISDVVVEWATDDQQKITKVNGDIATTCH
jgi:hypothetical protein